MNKKIVLCAAVAIGTLVSTTHAQFFRPHGGQLTSAGENWVHNLPVNEAQALHIIGEKAVQASGASDSFVTRPKEVTVFNTTYYQRDPEGYYGLNAVYRAQNSYDERNDVIQVLDRLSSHENMSFATNEKVLFDIGLLCMHELGMNKLDEVQRVLHAFYSKAFYNAPAEKNRHLNAIGMFIRTLRAYMEGLPAKKAAQARARSEKNAARNKLAPSLTHRRKQFSGESTGEQQWLLPISPLKLMRYNTPPLAPTAA